ncbi:MAG: FN3 associated domain-containing protein [Paludibacter sp.]
MRKTTFFKMVLVAILLLIGNKPSFGQLIAGWDFQTTTNGGTVAAAAPNSPSVYVANFGAGTLYLNGTNGSSTWITTTTGNEVTSFSGTAINAGTSFSTTTTTPACLAIVGGGTTGNYTANGKSIVFKFSMTEKSNLTVSYAAQKSGTGFSSHVWEYSTNGTSWITAQTISNIASSFAAITINTITGLDNAATAYLKLTVTGASATNGNNRLDNIQLTSASVQTAATPTFSITPGNVTSSQSVALETTTSGASIYYTLNGTTPNNIGNGTLYTGTPIPVNSTTTIKAIAYSSGMTTSPVSTATYTFPTSVATIADLRAAATPGFYKLTGEAVLTLKSSTRNAKYIQDATGAVLIDDPTPIINTAYNVGDGITGITGTTALYNNMLQFTPVTDPGAATSTNNTVTPTTLVLADLINHQGKLVKVLSTTITGSGSFAAATSYDLNGSSATVIRTQYSDLNYIGQAIPTTAQDITGVVLVFGTTAQLVPRSLSDFSASTATSLNPVKDNSIHAANGNIVLSASANQTVEIFNAVGQKLLNLKAVEGQNTIPVSAKGLLLVKVGNQISKVIL